MPELAEVEIVRRNLRNWWKGCASEILWSDATFGKPHRQELRVALESKPIEFIRRGKHLVVQCEDGGLYFHLRMTGQIIASMNPNPPFARLAFRVEPGRILKDISYPWLVFVDPRRLGSLDYLSPNSLPKTFEKLGPEPYDLSVDYLEERISGKRMLKSALLDQSVVAGIGNIAISELFWRFSIAPNARWSDLSSDVKSDFCSYLGPYFDSIILKEGGKEINYTHNKDAPNPFTIYKRLGEPCPRCTTKIDRIKVASRSTYYCPHCQNK